MKCLAPALAALTLGLAGLLRLLLAMTVLGQPQAELADLVEQLLLGELRAPLQRDQRLDPVEEARQRHGDRGFRGEFRRRRQAQF